MSIKTHFSIKDLENLSGVKAHTIRIWEKRYHLLNPERTETNIRKYNLENLKRLLDVTFLYQEGFKISKIASYDKREIKEIVAKTADKSYGHFAITSFKSAMLNFDSKLFDKTYRSLLEKIGFQKLFFEIFIPFLEDIGIQWQTNTIDISHERFIAELIKRKTILHIENERKNNKVVNKDITFCLFAPPNEMHDLGLLYANFELEKFGFSTVYLGPNTPLESLPLQLTTIKEVIFVAYVTQQPAIEDIYEYLKNYNLITSTKKKRNLWLMGPRARVLNKAQLPDNIRLIRTYHEFTLKVNELNMHY